MDKELAKKKLKLSSNKNTKDSYLTDLHKIIC